MATRVADRIEEWETASFEGGLDALRSLLDRAFSGVVEAAGTRLFVTSGTPVALWDGEFEAFERRGTLYNAPSPALPLLAVMQARSDTVREEFYTEQTPIPEVDETLSEGGFTGYIELSEDVLSGDYYLVYHAGESTSVAFVGQSARLKTAQEAFELAAEEVGIYQVRPVEIEPLELPAPTQRSRDSAASGEAAGGEVYAVPSLDPALTTDEPAVTPAGGADHGTSSGADGDAPETTAEGEDSRAQAAGTHGETDTGGENSRAQAAGTDTAGTDGSVGSDERSTGPTLEALADRVGELESAYEQLHDRVLRLQTEHDDPAVDSPEGSVQADRDVEPGQARRATTLFARYDSRAETTLEDVHEGGGSRDELAGNLRVEVYGEFETSVSVDGQPYRLFVTDSLEYRFVTWLLEELAFEIRDTDSRDTLGVLYDALPRLDRVAFDTTLTVDSESVSFDLVGLTSTGDPLFVADCVRSGSASGRDVERLATVAGRVGETNDSLAGAFVITGGAFEPGATRSATQLVRETDEGSVVLDTKSQSDRCHLCLVEARESVNLLVPEL